MDEPIVSVLVPCFRSAAFVRRALDSVLGQGFRHWELVVVDNASDDGTWEVLAEYARRDPRIHVHRNDENLGPVRNWRRAAALARGRFAGLLFSDDWYGPDFLERAVGALEDPSIGWVQSAVRVVEPGQAPRDVAASYVLDGPPRHDSREYLRSVLEGRGPSMPYSPACSLMRSGDLARWLSVELPEAEAHGYLRHGAGPDVLCYLQAAAEYPAFFHLADPQVAFLKHGHNLSKERDVARAYVTALRWFLESRPDAGADTAQARAALWWRARRTGAARPALGPAGLLYLGAYLLRRASHLAQSA